MNFKAPSVTQIADFLIYLFQERKLQSSTTDGYRTAIADMVGNSSVKISKEDNLTRLLDSFHRDRPKGRRGIPSWNLSLVLHKLTEEPFKPLKLSLNISPSRLFSYWHWHWVNAEVKSMHKSIGTLDTRRTGLNIPLPHPEFSL